jgi:predicted ATPase
MLTDQGVAERTTRLLTLTGGRSGKTRLAVQAVMDLLNRFKDGVWWANLAPLMDQTLVPQTVARALGVSEKPNEPMVKH